MKHPLDEVIRFIRLKPFADFMADDYHVISIPADHDKRENCLIYIIEREGKCILYDAGESTQWEKSDPYENV